MPFLIVCLTARLIKKKTLCLALSAKLHKGQVTQLSRAFAQQRNEINELVVVLCVTVSYVFMLPMLFCIWQEMCMTSLPAAYLEQWQGLGMGFLK